MFVICILFRVKKAKKKELYGQRLIKSSSFPSKLREKTRLNNLEKRKTYQRVIKMF